jgi:Sulfotransferase family
MKQAKSTITGVSTGVLPRNNKRKAEKRLLVGKLLAFTTLSAAATSVLWTIYVSPRFFNDAALGPSRSRIIWDAAGYEVVPPPVIRLSSSTEAEALSLSLQQQSLSQSIPHQQNRMTSTQQQQQAIHLPPTCQVQNIAGRTFDRIHFLHMRKAGGTALRMYFKRLAKKHHIPVHVDEGAEFPEQPGDDNHTFYVTVIREPVARSLSQYKFDQRWDCRTQLKLKDFVPTNDNVITTFEDFVNRPSRFHPDIRGPLWICSSNCYARWSTGILYPNESNVTDDALLESASNVLNRYNLVLVQEWIQNNAAYRNAVARLFQTKNFGNREYFAECARESRRANERVPLIIANCTLQQLQRNNQVDSALFNHLTASCQYDPSSFQPLQYNSQRVAAAPPPPPPQKTA